MGLTAPPEETAWLLHHILGFNALEEADTSAVLQEITRTAEGVLAPLDRDGDRLGVRLGEAGVITAPGFAEAFRAYTDAGWMGIAASAEYGGQGLPHVLGLAALEPVSSANMAFGLCPLLTQDAITLLQAHGSAEQRQRWLPPLIAGRWTGTMCLSESQAGSDLSSVRTRATPDEQGGYRVRGEKIFITWGDHAMTENILHLVLARLPGAPAGSNGLSLFAVPKLLADGRRNAVTCTAVEHKLGIHGSPTCTLAFEDAEAELVGHRNRGLFCMFAMMTAARLAVAIQGVGVAERAFRRAAAFAAQREQGGALIEHHPDVRRMLWTMRALALGGRLLAFYAASATNSRAALLTPVAKAWCTEAGVEAASLGVQVHGGMGFIEDTGAAQHLRDARIAPIYEGTNGIMAQTLLRRGVLRDKGAALLSLVAEIETGDAAAPALLQATAAARAALAWACAAESRAADAGATPLLQLVGTLVAGWLCARVQADADAPPAARLAGAVFVEQVLPRVACYGAMAATASTALVGDDPIG
jgi:alkylation response protein AidB-like acyl-CoA dehydrogenase